jgi:hypothetical protein
VAFQSVLSLLMIVQFGDSVGCSGRVKWGRMSSVAIKIILFNEEKVKEKVLYIP